MKKKENIRFCLWLFWKQFSFSAFTFGGGYVILPMMRKYYLEKKKLFTEEELNNMAAIAQSSPGAIAVNLSVLVGYRLKGIFGAVLTCVASVLPPLILLSVISSCYAAFRSNHIISAVLKGMEAGVAALIVDCVIDMAAAIFKQEHKLLKWMVPAAFVASFLLKINVILILIFYALACLAEGFWKRKKGGRE